MPRFRFQWQHIPSDLREILAKNAKLDGVAPEHFIKKFGKRPTLEFVRQLWPILLDHWIDGERAASARIALALRLHDLGDPSVADDVAYLRTCRNTQRLREVVLLEFITYGENPVEGAPHAPATPSIDGPADATPDASTPISMPPTTPHDPIDVLRQQMVVLLQKHFPTIPLALHDDGDISLAVGSSMLFLSIVPEPFLVRVYAILLQNVTPTAALYETLNYINHKLQIGRIFAIDSLVVLESAVPQFALAEPVLLHTIGYIASIADEYDDRLQRSFGGDLWGTTQAGDMIDV